MDTVTLDVPRHKTLATFVALPLAFSFARTIQDEVRVYSGGEHSPQAAQLVFQAYQSIVAGATLSARAFVRESAGRAVVASFAASS